MGIGILMGIKIKAKARCQKGKGSICSNMVNNDNISSDSKEKNEKTQKIINLYNI